jgi:putative transposase
MPLVAAAHHEGEVLEAFVSKRRDRKAALKSLSKLPKRHGPAETIVTDKLRSYGAAMRDLGNSGRQVTGQRLNNRVENSHLPFRRRERATTRFRRMRSPQKFVAVHGFNRECFNKGYHLSSSGNSKLN